MKVCDRQRGARPLGLAGGGRSTQRQRQQPVLDFSVEFGLLSPNSPNSKLADHGTEFRLAQTAAELLG